MGISTMPELSMVVDAGPGSIKALSIRQRCELLRQQVETERASFVSHWRDLNDYILPRRARFFTTDTNKGDRRTQKIIRGTATRAVRVLASGMMAGITSPSRPWFQLSTVDPTLNDSTAVKEWLHDVAVLMMDAFRKSNLYNVLPVVYGDMGVFGTGAMFFEEDDERVFRFTPFAIGEYGIGNDEKLRVRIFVRTFRLTVEQVVKKWGQIDAKTGMPNFLDGRGTTISITTQNLWRRGTRSAWVDLVHVIQPNLAYDGQKIDSKYKAFEEIYYERGAPNQTLDASALGVLSHMGYDEFPVLVPRWEVTAGDVYGTNCPGMVALGDIKELQTRVKRMAQAEEKMVNPPMVGPSAMRNAKTSILPGDMTYAEMSQHNQFRPAHDVNYGSALGPMEQATQELKNDIDESFYKNLFLMIAESDRRQITATEIEERKQEKLLGLGPMLEQLNQDCLDPMIDRAFNILVRKGLIPHPPEELAGVPLRVEYVSIMAQAQKAVTLGALDRFAGFAGQVAQYDQSALDKIDSDELMDQYADAVGVPPKVLRSDEDVQQLRAQRQQQQAQAQAAENAPKLAGAAKDLSQSPTDGSSVLANIIGRARARATLGATSSPPQSLVG